MIIEQGALVALTISLVQIIKKIDFINERFLPLASLLIGFALHAIYGIYAGMPAVEIIFYGLMVGTAAAGTFDLGKKTVLGK